MVQATKHHSEGQESPRRSGNGRHSDIGGSKNPGIYQQSLLLGRHLGYPDGNLEYLGDITRYTEAFWLPGMHLWICGNIVGILADICDTGHFWWVPGIHLLVPEIHFSRIPLLYTSVVPGHNPDKFKI